MAWTVACWRVSFAACLIALASCAPPDKTKVCSANGETYLCPEDMECGGLQRLCVGHNGCGNGVVDGNEQCDDGNLLPGDGCSPDCKREECGNGILDPHEICDDGNTKAGDGCSADCLSKEVCGNGIVDKAKGEVCDDGVADAKGNPTFSLMDGDGCSADCKSQEICGNHITDTAVGEVCDDGNTRDGDGCSSDCRSTEACNNGKPDPGEECDHGLYDLASNATGNNDTNDCRADCFFNRCGDGHVNLELGPHHEDCDGAPPVPAHSTALIPTETRACNIDCTVTRCGDGKINRTAGEECDDSNAVSGDGCSANCKLEFCGDGVTNNLAHEQCDPTDPAFGPSRCNADCTFVRCGDGKLNFAAGEQCDDGNNTADDGCSPDCKFEHCGNGTVDPREECDGTAGLSPCNLQTCLQERCGNTILDSDNRTGVHEQCDDGNTFDNDGCAHDCKIEFCGDGITNNREPCDPTDPAFGAARCNTDCTLTRCGDGKLDTAAGEQCDDGNIRDGDGCAHDCKLERCGNGVLDPEEQCDGALGLLPCNVHTCLQERCGNGILDNDNTTGVHEQCDDGNPDDNDGCSHDCKFEFCGDGIVNNGEPCDRALSPATCNLDCTLSACGDGKLNPSAIPSEQCDDHNTHDGDGCSATCTLEHCGNGVVDAFEECDGAAGLQPCNPATCHQERCGNGILDNDNTTGVHEQCDDGNPDDNDGCSHDCKFEFCGDGIVNNGEPCDRALSPATCNLDCTPSACGDGKVNAFAIPPEQCDDHNTHDGDGCSATCTLEHCGNGVVDAFEDCDGTAGLQPCNTATCHQERCGNGILDNDNTTGVHEQCDDGNPDDNDGCSHDCKFEFCGDGIVNHGEPCDRALTPATCNLDCTPSVCGDGKVNAFAIPPEQCDDGGTVSGDGCSATCRLEHCGNGVVDAFEECDGLAGPQPCSTSCHQEICGNGILDNDDATGVHEQCDDGNPDDGDGCAHDCKLERCGNGILDPLEDCDGTTGLQPCNTQTCHQERCGNGILDVDPAHSITEQCDDGNPDDNDGCSHDCKFEFCGDGIVNHGEPCDRALTPATCNLDCTPSTCGDGKVNAFAIPPEQCDDGGTVSGDGCSATCRLEHCGNGVIDAFEECDFLAGPQPCSTSCHQERCGNGILDNDDATGVHEQCDDGNPDDGDGCAHDCKLERCGNGILDPLEDCDGTTGLQPCNTQTCHQERCGNGILDNDSTTNVHEQCDDGNPDDGDGCSHTCTFEFCGDGIVNHGELCDRALTPETCNLDCTPSVCGDHKVNAFAIPAEECDDGGTVSGDGCSATCTLEHCGNGVVDRFEDCDGLAGPQPCSASCHQEICGNGILDHDPDHNIAEQCDDSNIDDGDGCSHDCKFEFCGDGIVNHGELCDRALTPETCNLDCTPSVCGDGKVNAFASPPEQCDDGGTVSGDGCSATCRLEHCGNGVVDAHEDCDGTTGPQPCSASCHQEICGNGILDHDPDHNIAEQCDDGNPDDGDGCSHTCTFEFCGDGLVNHGEFCDRAATPATCNLDCTLSACGDGKVNPFAEPPEQCDDGGTVSGDGCSATCTFEALGRIPGIPASPMFSR